MGFFRDFLDSFSIKKTVALQQAIQQAAAENFSMETLGSECIMKTGKPVDSILKVNWHSSVTESHSITARDVVFLFLFGRIGFTANNSEVSFSTFHAISSSGVWRYRLYRLLFGAVEVIAQLILFAGVLVFFIAVTLVGMCWANSNNEYRTEAILGFLASFLIFVIGGYGVRFARSRALPQSIRLIGRNPIRLRKIEIIPMPGNRRP